MNNKINVNEKDKNLLLGKIHSYRETQIIYIAAKLGISDLLIDGEKTVDELSELTKTDKESLYRVLRALTSIGIYKEKNKKFYITDLAVPLISNIPDSIKSIAIMRGEEVNWKPWGELLYAVKTGKSAFKKVFDMDLFEYYEKYPESGAAFDSGMSIFTRNDVKTILNNYDFSGFKKIVDVGGGNGALITSVLENYKECNGTLYDLPHVVKEAKKHKNLTIIGGDMFTSVPKGGDCYLLKKIIHDWDDDRSIQIITNCRDSIYKNGRILLVEMVIEEDKPTGKINDVHMMVVCPGGKERTKDEFEYLLNNSGFKLSKVINTDNVMSIIEGIPI